MTLLEFALTLFVGWIAGVLTLGWRVRNLMEQLRVYRRAERRRIEHERRVTRIWSDAMAALEGGGE